MSSSAVSPSVSPSAPVGFKLFLKKASFFFFLSFVFSAQRGEGLKSDPPKVQHPPSRTMTYSICSPSHHTMLRVLICDLPKARHQASLSLKKD